MKITKDRENHKVYVGKCTTCKCEIEANENEVTYLDQRDDTLFVKCPYGCSYIAVWESNRKSPPSKP